MVATPNLRLLRLRVAGLALVASAVTVLAVAGSGQSLPGDTMLVSLGVNGLPGDRDSADPSLSASGRYVAFSSLSGSLVSEAPGSFTTRAVFVRDMVSGTIAQASWSIAPGSDPNTHRGNGDSFEASISGDGTRVSFTSRASDLVPGDTNGVPDIFVRDLATGTTTRVSRPQNPDEPQANFASVASAISSDGRWVAYSSSANNIYPGDTNAGADVFVWSLATNTTELVSVGSGGSPSAFGQENNTPAISGDGRYIAFQSDATNWDTGDTNGKKDIWVRDRVAHTTVRVSQPTGGGAANGDSSQPAISADGLWIAYVSNASNLAPGDTNGDDDVFLTNRVTGVTKRISVSSAGVEGLGSSAHPSVNADGTIVTYESAAENLVPGDTNGVRDIFVWHADGNRTSRESLTYLGQQVSLASGHPSTAGDGHFVAFHSYAKGFVAIDTSERSDVFLHELGVADRTPPNVTGVPDRPANSDGWYNAPVTIDWQSVDPEPSSGAATDPPNTIANTEGRDVTYTSAPSCDPNMNCATGSLKLSIDKTAPVVTATVPPPNANGWYRDPIVVGFACTDALSGIVSCAPPVTVTTEGANQTATGTSLDRAGNAGGITATGINVDRTAPTVAFGGNAGTYTGSQMIDITCTPSDSLSGIDSTRTTCPTVHAPAGMFLPGPHTLEATAFDKAGNQVTVSTTFTTSVDASSLGDLACSYEATKRQERVCKKLREILARAQASAAAGDIKQANDRMKEFIKVVQDERGKAFTQEQASLLTALAALVYY